MAGRPPEPDDEREPTPDADDIDVRFADITASLGDITVPPADDHDVASGEDEGDHESAASPVGEPRDHAGAGDEDEDGYEPPEPAPLSGGDPLLGLAWVGVCLPIALILIYLVLWRGMPLALLGVSGAAFVLSVGVLVWRMPGRRDGDDHDDGAVV